jgi:hypothetical protein
MAEQCRRYSVRSIVDTLLGRRTRYNICSWSGLDPNRVELYYDLLVVRRLNSVSMPCDVNVWLTQDGIQIEVPETTYTDNVGFTATATYKNLPVAQAIYVLRQLQRDGAMIHDDIYKHLRCIDRTAKRITAGYRPKDFVHDMDHQ